MTTDHRPSAPDALRAGTGEREDLFRAMAESAPVMMWVSDPDGRCTYMSRRWHEFTGQTAGQALGLGWLEAVHPEDRPRIRGELAEARGLRAPFRVDYRLSRADGRYGWAIDSGAPRLGPDGAFLGYIGSVIDIDERKAVEDALRESEARFRALFSAIDEGYCLCEMLFDEEGEAVDYRFLEANRLFETMTGLQDAVGRTALDLVPGLERHWIDTYARVALEREPLRFTQGSAAMGRAFDVFATPVEPHGRFALVFNDVTERQRLEEVRREGEAAERRARLQAELLAEIHRELEPLDRGEDQVRRLAELLVADVADVARVDLPVEGNAAPDLTAAAARDAGDAARVEDVPVRVAAPVDVGLPEPGRVVLGFRDAAAAPPAREAEAFARRVADHVGTIVARARVRDREHRIAVRLQEALLPAHVLGHAEVEVAARYEAGSDALEVGGDFHATFALPGGGVGVAVGDVVGHGLEAAARMGRLRTALTALAPLAPGPGGLLDHLDAYATGPDAVEFATACCAFLDPGSGVLRYAAAGHPPMLVVAPDGVASWLDEGRSPPLHGVPHPGRAEASVALEPGTLLVLYSDGLVERRREVLERGLDRLREAATAARHLPVGEICDRLIARLGVHATRDDDVVVLCLRTGPARSG